MAGYLQISPDRHWTASGGLLEWVVRWLADNVQDAELATRLTEIADAHLDMLVLDDFPSTDRQAILDLMCRGLVPAARRSLRPTPGSMEVVMKHLQSLTRLACIEGNPSPRTDQFMRHGSDFRATSEDEYARLAAEFLRRSWPEGVPTKRDGDGVTRMYDPQSNTFAVYNPDLSMRTFFKPDPARHGYPTNWDFWLAQPGSPTRWA